MTTATICPRAHGEGGLGRPQRQWGALWACAFNGKDLTQASPLTTADLGTAPGNVVQLDASGRLPALDGGQLTGLSADQISGLSGVPTGAVLPWPAAALPAGFARCNGAEVDRAVWGNLFAVIGTTYGAGDGSTTFNLPDFRGVTLRGLDRARGLGGPTSFGVYQADAFQGHWHGANASSGGATNSTNNGFYHMTAGGAMGGAILSNFINAGYGAPRVDTETRGKAYGIDWIIKA